LKGSGDGKVGLGSFPGLQCLGFGARTTIEIYVFVYSFHAVFLVHGQAQNERDQVPVVGYFVYYCVEAKMDGWMDGWMHGCMDGWMDAWMDGWMHGWMDALRDTIMHG
jgi:hypothetical protein